MRSRPRTTLRGSHPALLALLLLWSACGGGNQEDAALITGQPTPTPKPPRALSGATDVSRINFNAATEDLFLTMITEEGLCIVNQTTDIVVLAGDFASRPVPEGIPIAFFVARGRGLVDEQALTGPNGTASVAFQSLCPVNFSEEIAVAAAVRGAEPFSDLNSNGRHDEGEPFQDLDREAFMDANLNALYEPELGEYLIWDANGNGEFDAGGNGRYDRDNIIVDYTLVIPVRPSDLVTPSPPPSPTETPVTPATATETRTPPPTTTSTFTRTATETQIPTDTPPPTDTPEPSATPTATPGAEFIKLELVVDRRSDNGDGTFTSVIGALITDANGVAIGDGVRVDFVLIDPVAGVSVTSPGFTNQEPPCSVDFTVRPQPGNSLSCVKYTNSLQGTTVTVRARVATGEGGTIEDVAQVKLPDDRPAPSATATSTGVPSATPTETPIPSPAALRFVGAAPSAIGVRASGLSEQSILTFEVTDANSRPIAGVPMNFELLEIGDESIEPASAVTDADGRASTTVTTGSRAGTLRVVASVDRDRDGNDDLFTQSTAVAVFGAPPVADRFSVAAEKRNVPGRRILGIRNPIEAFVNDRFGNAAPPGTAVSFVSNGASVVDQEPTGTDGAAPAVLITEQSIPPTGIVTVLAFTRGEEPFLDNNGNGVFDDGIDAIRGDDLPEPFIDFRPLPGFDGTCSIPPPSPFCNGDFDTSTDFELFVDDNDSGVWDMQGSSGVLDREILIFASTVVTFSGTLVTPSAQPTSFAIPDGGSQLFVINVHDDLQNPLAGGSTIDIAVDGADVTPDAITVPDAHSFNQIVPGATQFSFVVSDSDPGDELGAVSTTVFLQITSENGDGTFAIASGTID